MWVFLNISGVFEVMCVYGFYSCFFFLVGAAVIPDLLRSKGH